MISWLITGASGDLYDDATMKPTVFSLSYPLPCEVRTSKAKGYTDTLLFPVLTALYAKLRIHHVHHIKASQSYVQ